MFHWEVHLLYFPDYSETNHVTTAELQLKQNDHLLTNLQTFYCNVGRIPDGIKGIQILAISV